MIEGIDYYPHKKQRHLVKVLWLLPVILVLGWLWYFIDKSPTPQTQSTVIIIKKPATEKPKSSPTVVKPLKKTQPKQPQGVYSQPLDQVIQTYETDSHNQ